MYLYIYFTGIILAEMGQNLSRSDTCLHAVTFLFCMNDFQFLDIFSLSVKL